MYQYRPTELVTLSYTDYPNFTTHLLPRLFSTRVKVQERQIQLNKEQPPPRPHLSGYRMDTKRNTVILNYNANEVKK